MGVTLTDSGRKKDLSLDLSSALSGCDLGQVIWSVKPGFLTCKPRIRLLGEANYTRNAKCLMQCD